MVPFDSSRIETDESRTKRSKAVGGDIHILKLLLASSLAPSDSKAAEGSGQRELHPRAMHPTSVRGSAAVAAVTSVLSAMFVLGVVGNALVCVALYRNRRLRTVGNVFVLSLAFADFLELLTSRPLGVVAVPLRRWPFGDDACQMNGFVVYYWCVLSTSTLAMAAASRFVCLFKPETYKAILTKNVAVRAVFVVWISLFLLGLIITAVTPFRFEYNSDLLFCAAVLGPRAWLVFIVCMVIFFYVPFFVTFYCYARLLCTIRQHLRRVVPTLRAFQGSSHYDLMMADFKTVRILLATVGAFCLCWTPLTIVATVSHVRKAPSPNGQTLAALFAAASSFVNPVIYGMMNRAMRREFVKLLRCRR